MNNKMTKETMTINSINRALTERMTIVKSGSNDNFVVIHNAKAYVVQVEDNIITSCDCPNHKYRNVICKHMIKVSNRKKLLVKTTDEKEKVEKII